MKNIKLTAIKIAFSIVAVLFLSANILAQKTETPARMFYEVVVITVKPEMAMEFGKLVKTEYNPAFIKGGGKESNVWNTAIGNVYEFVFVQPIEKFAVMDGQSALEKGLGKEGAAAFFAKADKMVSSVRTYIIQTRPDLSYMTEMKSPPKLAIVAHITVAQGRENDFENFTKNEWLPVVSKSGIAGYLMSKVIFGGNISEYISLTLQENFADLDKGIPTARVLGQEGAMKLQQKLPAGTIVSLERYVAMYNSDLSVMQTVATK